MDITRYSIGWIAPLALERKAAEALLDESYGNIQICGYIYYGGRIGQHNIIIGTQPDMGTDAASDLARRMCTAFPNIRLFVVVGIGGGVPSYGPIGNVSQIVLGDIVVSTPRGKHGGVVRWDTGACVDEGRVEFSGHLDKPPQFIRSAVIELDSQLSIRGTKIPAFLREMRLKKRADTLQFEDPGAEQDRLFNKDYPHPKRSKNEDCADCCDQNRSQLRHARGNEAARQIDTPKIHYGNIASSNLLQISSVTRDRLQQELEVICFEMEGAGVIQNHPCLVVRGICDYSDSHKNKKWQPYAAATAAAYTKELLRSLPANPLITLRDEEDKKCIRHLHITDPRDDKKRIEDSKGGLLNDSYRWVLDNADFQQWRDKEQSRLLWIKGDPGKGKTMLLCGIINELQISIPQANLTSYFFCQATDARLNNATAVLRGLLYMIFNQQPSFILHARKKYDQVGKALFENANAWVALTEIFADVLQDPNLSTTYLVIDALDECKTDLLKLLDFVVKESSACTRVKWILSSRNWPEIEERLQDASHKVRLSLELNVESVSTAVRIFIKEKVSQLKQQKKYDKCTQDTVMEYLASNAEDTFLWVALVCQELKATEKWRVLKKLKSLPPGLDSLYKHMMQRIIDSEDAELCKHILASITLVYRPITLKEMVALVEQLEGLGSDWESIRKIVSYCGSFLTLQEDTIYFVHQSAKEFLFNNAAEHIFPSGKESIHYTIFTRSLEVLSKTLRRDVYNLGAPGYPTDQVEQPDPDPLATSRYSCIYWVDHLYNSNSTALASHKDSLRDEGHVDAFLREKFLYWLEALSLCRSIPKGILSMKKLWLLAQVGENATAELIYDAHRFIMYHKVAIEESPLQAYVSALLFSPSKSLIKNIFQREVPEWITIKLSIGDNWSTCLQTLEGHSRWVRSVAFSPDSTRLVSASVDNTVKIWDASSGTCLQTLEGHSNCVNSVAFSPDSTQLASASDDHTVKIWDVSSGTCLQTLEGYSGCVNSVAFSPDSTRLASASGDNTVKIWDASSGTCLQTLEDRSHSDLVAILASLYSDKVVEKSGQPIHKGDISISADSTWICNNAQKLLWLPIEYRPTCTAILGRHVGLGTGSRKVWMCRLE